MSLHATQPPPGRRFPLDRPLLWLVLLALAHVAVRVAISPALRWDEAEQMLWSQQLAWGYGAQPPLYSWLQWGVNGLVGPSVLSLSLFKHGLLVACYSLMWLAARQLLGARGAWWAAASMMLIPTLGWFAIRDLTHTVLITAVVGATWWLLFRIVKLPRPIDFALLGLVCALGMLAKYSFALIAVAMLLAALSEPVTRRALLSPGWWWAPLVGLVLVAPHTLWMLAHWQQATGQTIETMAIDRAHGLPASVWSLTRGVVGALLLWVVWALAVFGAAWWRGPLQPAVPWAWRVLTRYLLLVALALLAMAWLGDVSVFKGRWMLPMFCVAPLAGFVARPGLQHHRRARLYELGIVAVALLVLVLAGLRPWWSSRHGDAEILGHPIVEVAAALRQAGYDGRSTLVASDHITAGMLRSRFRHAPVIACDALDPDALARCVRDAIAAAEHSGGGWLLVDSDREGRAGWWADATRLMPEPVQRQARQAQLPFHYMPQGQGAWAAYTFFWHPGSGD